MALSFCSLSSASSLGGSWRPTSLGGKSRRRQASQGRPAPPPARVCNSSSEGAKSGGDEAASEMARLQVSRRQSLGMASIAAGLTVAKPGVSSGNNGAAVAAEVAAASPATPKAAAASEIGAAALRNPSINHGLALPLEARKALKLDGLLPPGVVDADVEVLRAEAMLARSEGSLQKYQALISLLNTDRETFYRVVQRDVAGLLPVVYTPTVGDACLSYGSIVPRAPGLFISSKDKGRIAKLLSHWPDQAIRAAVVTDGGRILGLGDIGAHGMGIAVGKAMVYSVTGALPPEKVLPICVDVGTGNEELRRDPLYLGLRQPRVVGDEYLAIMDELVDALQARFGDTVLIHWEDFQPGNAFALLQRYRSRACTFNDDIQSTAAAVVGAMLGALRVEGCPPLPEQRFLFFGAGQANIGAAELLLKAFERKGVSDAEARARIWLFDSRGLVVEGRAGVSKEKAKFARPAGEGLEGGGTLLDAVKAIKPTALIGAATVPGVFTREIVQLLCRNAERPVVMALSNPSSQSECTAQEALQWSNGRALFASGSPFSPVTVAGRTVEPVQANNCLVFPGVALGCRASGASVVTPDMFYKAATALGKAVTEEELERGSLLPPVGRLGDCTVAVAAAVARSAVVSMVASTVEGSQTSGLLSCLADGGTGGDSASDSTMRECMRGLQWTAR